MNDRKKFRVFATARIGNAAENLLRARGYELEVFQGPEAPPKKLIIEKVKKGIDGLITTLRDPIDAEVFEAGKGRLKVVAQIAVGFDNINRADANKYKIPFTNTADVLTEATAEFAFFMMDLRHARGIQKEKTWIKYVEFEDALRDADYVSLHVPLLRQGEADKPTYHLINENTLKLMKPTAYLVNSSRGPVVDEKALAKAL